MRLYPLSFTLSMLLLVSSLNAQLQKSNLIFSSLPTRWDESLPLGNGMLGAMVWQKNDHLRFSLDCATLWDERPMKDLHRNEFSFAWVEEQYQKNNYAAVQKYFDAPYDREPAPSKIPGAALEFNTSGLGKVVSAILDISNALCTVTWASGAELKTFVDANQQLGWFSFSNSKDSIALQLIAPAYGGKASVGGDVVGGDDLSRLGYEQGIVARMPHEIVYKQKGWGGFYYTVKVKWWYTKAHALEGVWTIIAKGEDSKTYNDAGPHAYAVQFAAHANWWKNYWSRSSIEVPDTIINKQWYLEQYKFGATSRKGAPPISLQAIWTADNGRLPPWKGDFHHDLNTQMSYWPGYTANHLEESSVFTDYLNANKNNYKRYTELYFKVKGLNVPGVTTLDGTEMGGWIQYALSPTAGAWLAQHFYWQWKYSMDENFLKTKAYPWFKDVATYLENITRIDANGHRVLPLSSSPEINDNSRDAWFTTSTNYDLSLMKYVFEKAGEMAVAAGDQTNASHYQKIRAQFESFALSTKNELMFAKGHAYESSHRHFSHAMAIFPLGLYQWKNEADRPVMKATIDLLDKIGPANWCGYSYAWLSNLKARVADGEGAQKALNIFAKAFCAGNSFHLNGDQTKEGYSTFTYRPFTLEGNFAFASGVQEMLLQSYQGYVQIFPAVPASWKNVSFDKLRTEGAFIVSAKKENGQVKTVTIKAEKDGTLLLQNPFDVNNKYVVSAQSATQKKPDQRNMLCFECKKGAFVTLRVK
ncbi:MAG: glycosyl hydrolase family 95 catalytic domain-containing protein [Sediminibacterium sp.]